MIDLDCSPSSEVQADEPHQTLYAEVKDETPRQSSPSSPFLAHPRSHSDYVSSSFPLLPLALQNSTTASASTGTQEAEVKVG